MLITAAIALLALVADPFDAAAKKELKALAGEWEYVKAQTKDKALDLASEKPHVATIEGTTWTVRAKGGTEVRERAEIVALDTSTDPKLLDIRSVPRDPKREGVVLEGVYKLD